MKGGAGKLAYRAVLLGAIALSCAGVGQATAASRRCRQLQAELAGVDNGGRASPGQIRKYDSAIARQGEEMAKARSRAQRAGCGFSLFGGNIAACAALNASLDRMNRNLDTLRSQRARLAKGGSRRDRARIMASLDAHDCRDTRTAEKRTSHRKDANTGFLDQSAKDDELPPDTAEEPAETGYLSPLIDLSVEKAPRPQGEFRTLCVRTCDGYFFPMSNAASVRDFERDQKNCESSCPGTQMQVFYTRGFDDDPAAMISSADGKPYSELPTAYRYKKPEEPGAPACGCSAAQGFEIIGGNSSPRQQSRPESASIMSFAPAPAAKPAIAGPPEDMTGKDTATTEKGETSTTPAGERKVRVVAPAFLPDPKAAINLRVQAPKPNP
jgi:hypothetical protein